MSQKHWEAVAGSRRDAKMAEIEFERQYPFVKVAARLPMNPSPSTPCVALLRNESFSMQVIRRPGLATIHLSMYESPPLNLCMRETNPCRNNVSHYSHGSYGNYNIRLPEGLLVAHERRIPPFQRYWATKVENPSEFMA